MHSAGAGMTSHFVTTLAGIQMPKLVYGTAWKQERTAELVVNAVRAGFSGIDTACQPKHYHEAGVGQALRKLAREGTNRNNLFIQTKFSSVSGQDPSSVPYDVTAPLHTQVRQSLATSQKNLGLSYVDSLLLHSPMSTFDKTLEVWRVFESFIDSGRVRQIGISNCYNGHMLKRLYDVARVKPSVVQNRLCRDNNYDKEIRAFCKEKGIFYQSFWTLTANPDVLHSPKVLKMAGKRGCTSEQIFFAYLIQTGVVTPLTGTKNPEHMKEDLDSMDITLDEFEMKAIDALLTPR